MTVGKAEALAAAGALLDAPAHAPPKPQLLGRLPHLARAQLLADAARGEDALACADRLHHVDAEAEHAAERCKLGG